MERIKGLDGVRGIAALGVVGYHVAALGGYLGYNAFFDRTIGLGGCFVRLFFILSSFSLMLTYFPAFKNNSIDWEKFYKKRFIKLFPLFWLVMIAHVFLDKFMGATCTIWELIGTGTMTFGLMPSHQDSLVWAGWTMGLQMIFYMMFPAFLIFVKNRKRSWISFVLTFVLLMAYDRFYGVGIENSHINIIRQSIYFVVGAVIYQYSDWLFKLQRGKKVIVGLICLAVEISDFFLLKYLNGDIIMITSFSALIILQILGVDFIMKFSIFQFLGKISFEMYLLHTVVYRLFSLWGIQEIIHNIIPDRKLCQFMVMYCLILAMTIIFSFAIHKFFLYMERKIIGRCKTKCC